MRNAFPDMRAHNYNPYSLNDNDVAVDIIFRFVSFVINTLREWRRSWMVVVAGVVGVGIGQVSYRLICGHLSISLYG
jgi:hypothetical protein